MGAKAKKRSCYGKRKYSSRLDSLLALERLHHDGKDGLRSYRCEHCKQWHLGRYARGRWSS